jgi:hypothetical protein
MQDHWVEIQQAVEYFRPRQLAPALVLSRVQTDDQELESSIYQAAQTLDTCSSELGSLGPPPAESDEAEMWAEQVRLLEHACTSYAVAGGVFWEGLRAGNLTVMKSARPYIKDGDGWLRLIRLQER